MTSLWTLEGAQTQLVDIIDAAVTHGPQTITRDGEALVVVVSSHEWEDITNQEAESLVSPRSQSANTPVFAGNLKSFVCG